MRRSMTLPCGGNSFSSHASNTGRGRCKTLALEMGIRRCDSIPSNACGGETKSAIRLSPLVALLSLGRIGGRARAFLNCHPGLGPGVHSASPAEQESLVQRLPPGGPRNKSGVTGWGLAGQTLHCKRSPKQKWRPQRDRHACFRSEAPDQAASSKSSSFRSGPESWPLAETSRSTNSMIAIAAASDARMPALMIRV